jgi:hypothetical protein
MLRAIEHRGEEGVFVNVFKEAINVNDLVGGELTAEEVAIVNTTFPDSIPLNYVPRSLASTDEREPPDAEPTDD